MKVVFEATTEEQRAMLSDAIVALARVGLTVRQTDFHDVKAFHHKFGVPESPIPALLAPDKYDFRFKFLHEELDELNQAHAAGDLLGAGDALIDLVYVAHGTAAMMGLPWDAMWDEVQRANISKVRATSADQSKRNSTLDVIKPEGWTPPDHSQFIGSGPWPTF